MQAKYKQSRFAWWQLLVAIGLLAVGIVIGRIGLGTAGQSADTPQASPAPQANASAAPKAVMAVEAVYPKNIAITKTLDATGIMSAVETAEVSGRLTGLAIESVLVEVGDGVKAGQVLAVLDTKSLTEQQAQAEADLALAIANLRQAEADLARTEPLLEIDAVSRQEVDRYRTAVSQAKASIDAAQARLNTARTNQHNANVISPISGVIAAKHAQVGALANGSALFSIIKDGTLEWQATLTPEQAQSVSVGQMAQLTIANQTLSGSVTRLSPTANNSREIIAHVALPKHAALRAGMYQQGQFILSSNQHLSLPSRAVMSDDGDEFVWLLAYHQENDLYQIRKQPVQIVGRQDERVAVDLPADSLVVAQSTGFLNEGDWVSVASIDDPALMSKQTAE